MLKIFTVCGICFLTFLSSTVEAQRLYKWVDKDGTVKYSQTPPKNIEYETIKKKGKSSLGKTPQEYSDPNNPEIDEGESQTPEQRFVEAKKKNCTVARTNKGILQSKGNIRGMDGKLLSEDQVKQQVELAEQQIKLYCDSGNDEEEY